MADPALSPPRAGRLLFWLALLGSGLAWGATGPLAKLAVSTGHHAVGIAWWNTLFCALIMTVLQLAGRRRLPLDRRSLLFFLACGLLGTALPNALSYTAYAHLPVGVIVLLLSLVPMATLLFALPLGLERGEPRRLLGLALGILAVLLIVLPDTALPAPDQVLWVALPLLVATSYAAENVIIAAGRPR